ncbi:SagB/ThcOx family dehydrogenase [Halorussus gelatinilyticus]|uniref:SagB/ThcOx family dehydrogenase n=1 Tax=Halorussus gelatinilyticus TaxID=2937524 RepID=A0A8U0IEC8_9EURY|nr:SagB/ThcOx family dehydrogenase [Halorussus gelatinilyticus]UPV99055.1 SagB/ThcOx family dehydrogenase [Halorussus gelatinilyticus]
MVRAPEYHERTKHATSDFPDPDLELDFETMPRPLETYRDRPRVSLPGVRSPVLSALSVVAEADTDPLAGAEQTERDPVDAVTVASLCYWAAGVKHETDHPTDGTDQPSYYRMASCTGNLHHVEAYVVCGDLDGLDAGVYHFDPATLSLDLLREGDYRGVLATATGDRSPEADGEGSSAAADASPGVADAPVTVAVTSEWWRNAWKYRERTYRHAFWDSGTVVSHLLAAAHAFDLPASVVAGFDDSAVADLLGLDPRTEAPLELVPVGRGTPTGESPSVAPIDVETVPHPPRDRSHDLPHEAWATSALSDGEAVSAWREQVREALPVGRVGAGDGERVPLDPVDHGTEVARPVRSAMERRRSCRSFADELLSRRKLGTVLDRATRGVPGDWTGGGDDAGAPGLQLNDVYAIATDVADVPDGRYQFHPEEAALERLGDATSADQTRLALGQEWGGDAHVNVYCMTDVDRVAEALGDRGYRLAQLEAGVVLGRLYLATYAHRPLGGTGLTFYDDEVTDFLSPRAEDQTPTTMFAMGVAE